MPDFGTYSSYLSRESYTLKETRTTNCFFIQFATALVQSPFVILTDFKAILEVTLKFKTGFKAIVIFKSLTHSQQGWKCVSLSFA